MRRNPFLLAVGVGAVLGLFFAGVSTYDFVEHLDRQVHGVHCSFVPGLQAADLSGTSGCQVTMMSPYSSVLRSSMWGGLPISLPAMGVFAFLLLFTLELLLSGRSQDKRALGFLFSATCLPALASVVMGYIAFSELDAACKLCIGIYIASTISLVGAFLAWRRTKRRDPFASFADDDGLDSEVDGEHTDDDDDELVVGKKPAPASSGYLAGAFAAGVLCVAVPAVAYVGSAPNHDAFIAACGTLERPKDIYKIMLPLGSQSGTVPAVEVLDPLCPACRAFETRFADATTRADFARKVVLFPLDNTCNWMVDSAVHPGACTVSEAVLCAEGKAQDVVTWAFENQEAIREASSKDPGAARRMVIDKFPELRSCVGSAAARAKLNKSLRWAVRNRLQVLTPQLYVADVRLCDEDVDLGLDYALSHLVQMHHDGTLPKPETKPEPPRFVEPVDTVAQAADAAPKADAAAGSGDAAAAEGDQQRDEAQAPGETEAAAPEAAPQDDVAVPEPVPEPDSEPTAAPHNGAAHAAPSPASDSDAGSAPDADGGAQ